MASQRGMILRNEAANQRIDAALAGLTSGSSDELPEKPTPSRDAFLNTTQRLEWIADVLETVEVKPKATKARATTPKDGEK